MSPIQCCHSNNHRSLASVNVLMTLSVKVKVNNAKGSHVTLTIFLQYVVDLLLRIAGRVLKNVVVLKLLIICVSLEQTAVGVPNIQEVEYLCHHDSLRMRSVWKRVTRYALEHSYGNFLFVNTVCRHYFDGLKT